MNEAAKRYRKAWLAAEDECEVLRPAVTEILAKADAAQFAGGDRQRKALLEILSLAANAMAHEDVQESKHQESRIVAVDQDAIQADFESGSRLENKGQRHARREREQDARLTALEGYCEGLGKRLQEWAGVIGEAIIADRTALGEALEESFDGLLVTIRDETDARRERTGAIVQAIDAFACDVEEFAQRSAQSAEARIVPNEVSRYRVLFNAARRLRDAL